MKMFIWVSSVDYYICCPSIGPSSPGDIVAQVDVETKARQRTEAEQLLLTVCVFMCVSGYLVPSVQTKAKLVQQSKEDTHTHTEALCPGKQWSTYPVGCVPN